MATFTELLIQQQRRKAQLAGRPDLTREQTAGIVYGGALSASERMARAAETKRLEEAAVTQKEQFAQTQEFEREQLGEKLGVERERLAELKRAEQARLNQQQFETGEQITMAKEAVSREKYSSGVQVGGGFGYALHAGGMNIDPIVIPLMAAAGGEASGGSK